MNKPQSKRDKWNAGTPTKKHLNTTLSKVANL